MGITNENQLIRNSALFALGQFAEHLQPDISKYHAELLPVLFEYLTHECKCSGQHASAKQNKAQEEMIHGQRIQTLSWCVLNWV